MPYARKEMVLDLVHAYQNTSETPILAAGQNALPILIVIAVERVLIISV